MRLLCNLRRLVVADRRGERGDEHQRRVKQFGNARLVWLRPVDAVQRKRAGCISEQADLVQQVVRDQRLVDIQLKVPLTCGKGDRGVKAVDLYGNHRQGLSLGWVHLPRHDGGARLILWNVQLTESGARSGGEPTHVIGELHQRGCECAQRCGEVQGWLLPCERCELVWRAGKRLCREECDLLRCAIRKLWVTVESSAYRSSAEREREQAVARPFNSLNVSGECRSMRAELLSER